jgi:hypothetical protein
LNITINIAIAPRSTSGLCPTSPPSMSWPTMPIGRPATFAPSNAGRVFPWIESGGPPFA